MDFTDTTVSIRYIIFVFIKKYLRILCAKCNTGWEQYLHNSGELEAGVLLAENKKY